MQITTPNGNVYNETYIRGLWQPLSVIQDGINSEPNAQELNVFVEALEVAKAIINAYVVEHSA